MGGYIMTMIYTKSFFRSHGGARGFTPKIYGVRSGGVSIFDGAIQYPMEVQPTANLIPLCVFGDYLIAQHSLSGTIHRYHIINETWDTIGTLVGVVWAVAVIDGVMWIGGELATINGNNCRLNIVSYDGSSWTPYDTTTTSPRAVVSIAGDSSAVYVGRQVLSSPAGSDPALELVSVYSGGSWSVLTSGDGGSARAMAMHNGDLVIGGTFAGATLGTVGGLAGSVAIYNGSWTLTRRAASGTDTVNSLLSYEGELLAGGNSVTIGSTSTSIGRWDGSSWHAIANPGVSLESGRLLCVRGNYLLAIPSSQTMRRGMPQSSNPFDLQWVNTGANPPSTNIHPGPAFSELGPVP